MKTAWKRDPNERSLAAVALAALACRRRRWRSSSRRSRTLPEQEIPAGRFVGDRLRHHLAGGARLRPGRRRRAQAREPARSRELKRKVDRQAAPRRVAHARALAIALPPSSHFIYIPVMFILGIVIGFMLGREGDARRDRARAAEGRRARGAPGRAGRAPGRRLRQRRKVRAAPARARRLGRAYNAACPISSSPTRRSSWSRPRASSRARRSSRSPVSCDENGEFPREICKKAWETGPHEHRDPRGVRRPRLQLPRQLPGAGGDLVRLHRRQHDDGRELARRDAAPRRRHRRAEEEVPRPPARASRSSPRTAAASPTPAATSRA